MAMYAAHRRLIGKLVVDFYSHIAPLTATNHSPRQRQIIELFSLGVLVEGL